MVTKEQFQGADYPVRLKVMANGGFGTGKTFLAMTFPKWAYAMIEPNGILTAKQNPELLKNMVHFDEFVPSVDEDIKVTFERLSAYIAQCKQDAKEGKIQTFILDNGTHLSEMRWLYIEKYELQTSRKTGEVDTLSGYRALGDWMWKFFIKEVISIPCHVVVTFHQQEEMETVTDDGGRSKQRPTGRIITSTLGRFRDTAPGLFNASIFLERHKFGNGWVFKARCIGPEGAGKPAKNNLGLPEIIDNISFEKIMGYLKKEGVKNG